MVRMSSRFHTPIIRAAALPCFLLLTTSCDSGGVLPGLGGPLITVEADENQLVLADLSGDSYFVLRDPSGRTLYTKRGEMLIGADDKITNPSGYFVQGYGIDESFRIQTNQLADLSIPLGTLQVKEATTKIDVQGNLSPKDLNVGDSISTAFDVFDVNSNVVRVRITAKLSSLSDSLAVWDVSFVRNQDNFPLGSEIYVFDAAGFLEINPVLMFKAGNDDGNPPINVDFRSVSGNRALTSSIEVSSQDGAPVGTLEDYTIEGLGILSGSFSNGLVRDLGRFVVALIRDPETLVRVSAGVFSLGADTAEPFITTPSNL